MEYPGSYANIQDARYNPFTDTYTPKGFGYDSGVDPERQTVPAIAPFWVRTFEKPRKDLPSTIRCVDVLTSTALTEVSGSTAPAVGQFRVAYSGEGVGTIEFHSSMAGMDVDVSYYGLGTIVAKNTLESVVAPDDFDTRNNTGAGLLEGLGRFGQHVRDNGITMSKANLLCTNADARSASYGEAEILISSASSSFLRLAVSAETIANGSSLLFINTSTADANKAYNASIVAMVSVVNTLLVNIKIVSSYVPNTLTFGRIRLYALVGASSAYGSYIGVRVDGSVSESVELNVKWRSVAMVGGLSSMPFTALAEQEVLNETQAKVLPDGVHNGELTYFECVTGDQKYLSQPVLLSSNNVSLQSGGAYTFSYFTIMTLPETTDFVGYIHINARWGDQILKFTVAISSWDVSSIDTDLTTYHTREYPFQSLPFNSPYEARVLFVPGAASGVVIQLGITRSGAAGAAFPIRVKYTIDSFNEDIVPTLPDLRAPVADDYPTLPDGTTVPSVTVDLAIKRACILPRGWSIVAKDADVVIPSSNGTYTLTSPFNFKANRFDSFMVLLLRRKLGTDFSYAPSELVSWCEVPAIGLLSLCSQINDWNNPAKPTGVFALTDLDTLRSVRVALAPLQYYSSSGTYLRTLTPSSTTKLTITNTDDASNLVFTMPYTWTGTGTVTSHALHIVISGYYSGHNQHRNNYTLWP